VRLANLAVPAVSSDSLPTHISAIKRRKSAGRTCFFAHRKGLRSPALRPKVQWACPVIRVSIFANHPRKDLPTMSKPSAVPARTLANLTRDGRNRRRPSRALACDLTLQTLVADLVAARTAAGMTQQEVATRMWTTKSAVSRLESGLFARPTLNTIERYALAVSARVEIRVRASR
jgi:hypothetical protein